MMLLVRKYSCVCAHVGVTVATSSKIPNELVTLPPTHRVKFLKAQLGIRLLFCIYTTCIFDKVVIYIHLIV